jgi:hypothetical protein
MIRAASLISVKPRAQSARVIEEQDGNPSEAVSYARRYLAEKGAAISTKDADEVRGRIARLDSLLTPPPAAVVAAAPPPQAAATRQARHAGKRSQWCDRGWWTADAWGDRLSRGCLDYEPSGARPRHQLSAVGRPGQQRPRAKCGRAGPDDCRGAVLIGSTAWRIEIAKCAK